MKRALFWIGLAAVLIVPMMFMQAGDSVDDRGNPNDPAVNPRANACYAGAAMAGKCHTEDEWVAGWYFIRYQYGIITRDDVPADFEWVLPPVEGPGATASPTPTRKPL